MLFGKARVCACGRFIFSPARLTSTIIDVTMSRRRRPRTNPSDPYSVVMVASCTPFLLCSGDLRRRHWSCTCCWPFLFQRPVGEIAHQDHVHAVGFWSSRPPVLREELFSLLADCFEGGKDVRFEGFGAGGEELELLRQESPGFEEERLREMGNGEEDDADVVDCRGEDFARLQSAEANDNSNGSGGSLRGEEAGVLEVAGRSGGEACRSL